MIFKVVDYEGIRVILSKTTWYDKLLHPIFGHPEIKPYLSKIKETIKEPEYVFQSVRNPRSTLFFHKLTHGSYASYYLCVVIKYVKEQNQTVGYISTVMINRKLPTTSKLIWAKKALT